MTRATPPEACLVFLVDCSESMRAQPTATEDDVCGRTIAQLIAKVVAEYGDGERIDSAVLAYFTDRFGEPRLYLVAACAGFVAALEADSPNSPPPPAVRLSWGVASQLELPQGGGSPACHALQACGELLRPWVRRYSTARPPIVVHVTDGRVGDGAPTAAAQQLRTLRTDQGPLFLMTAVCGSDAPVELCVPSLGHAFPGDEAAPYALWRHASSSLANYRGESWNPRLSLQCGELYSVADDSTAVIYCRTNGDLENVALVALNVALGIE